MEAAKEKVNMKTQVFDWIKFIAKLFIIYVLITNTIGLTKVSGLSMSPTLKDNSLILINKFSVHFGKPEYGDVAIINEQGKGYEIIKRVLALPGDKIFIKDGVVYVNNSPVPEVYSQGKSEDMKEQVVPEGSVFVIGDNREPGESLDSRDPNVGPQLISDIKGYAVVSLFPAYKISKPLKIQ